VTKDAIADRMRDRCGTRPDSGPDYDRGAAVFLHWERDRMIIYLDTSGAPLCKRGYRKIPGSAPMQETLAAACIDALHWDRKTPFISPMCGSGTPAIEAALAAMNRAPGSLRSHFGFMSIKGYKIMVEGESAPRTAPRQRFGATPEQIWKDMLLEAQEQERTTDLPPIIATDISPEAIENAQTNAYIAGVSKYIQFKACDFGDTPIPPSTSTEPHLPFSQTGKEGYHARGCVFFNPEYGIRLGDPAELAPIYERIGTFMNEKCSGYTGGVLTGSPELSKMINLFYVTRFPFYNGPIDCRLFVFPGCEIKDTKLSTELSPSVDK
jgi:putative N6-adenine-specific DNA methylase